MERDISVLNGLQILRFIAAIFVVYAHYNFLQIRFGVFGVDIFFVISGFIISLIASSNPENFLKKRVARILPLYSIATMLVFILITYLPELFRNTVSNWEAFIKSLLFIPYRIENSGPLLSLGWTLNCEMFFYFTMALTISFNSEKIMLPLQCGLVFICCYLIFNALKTESYIYRFYANSAMPEFLLGIILFYIWKSYKSIKSYLIDITIIIFAVLAFSLMIYTEIYGGGLLWERYLYKGIPAFVVVFGFLVLDKYLNPKSFLIKLFVRLGDASYFTYLFHPFIIFGLTRLFYPIVLPDGSNTSIEFLKMLLSILVVSYCSLLGYRFLDKPLGNFTRRLLNI
ncbi:MULTISPECIES: acyltransferase family protein [unclassified Sphingobacterium]|uniref:acyltransferase family protein n=1 Tax=unclassified Sphingobacterium TaxID=2609468 RepID=UPI0025D2770B|nr:MULTISPECIES: acyltransferase [unclassified Sphingobacterium]